MPMDRLEAMGTLLAVVEAGSLSAASRRLGTPLATVSRRLSELEARLQTRLLHRSSRHFTLTDAGSAYIEACRRILDQVDEAESAASGEYRAPKGELAVTAPLFLGRRHMMPIAAAFLEAYPEVRLRLRLSDRVIDIQEDHIDLAVRIGLLRDSSLIARQVGTVRFVVCASPGYIARRGCPATPADLAAHDCVFQAGHANASTWEFPVGGTTVPVPIRSRLVVDPAEAVLDAGLAGAGVIRLLSYQIADAVGDGRLRVLLEAFEPPPLPVNLIHLAGALQPLKIRAFLDFAAPRLKARLAADLASP
jgi:DNA-binding transcriptional LysR family regulator